MTEKLSKLLDLFTEALSLYVRKTSRELGKVLPLDVKPALDAKPTSASRSRKTKSTERTPLGDNADRPIPAEESPFGTHVVAPAAAKAGVEEQLEIKRRSQEVMGLFIRRYLKAKPTGLDRAKEILNRECGRPIAKLEDLTYVDHVKLIPVFEEELERAEAAIK